MSELKGYDLSRSWFDFCFENPDLISPTHTALYFFAIEHCNRLGWKEKFGLPSQMCMDAIGVKNWRTYSKAFNDIVDWGFFKLVTKSKNQYSATIIAIVKNTKANTKALTKAMQKHGQKHDSSIVGINKPNNQEPNNHITPPTPNGENVSDDIISWKDDFNVYIKELREEFNTISQDFEWIKKQEEFNPNVDILKSIEKACVNYWATIEGWKKKKRARTKDINWKSTFGNAVSLKQNRVYKQTDNTQQKTNQIPAI